MSRFDDIAALNALIRDWAAAVRAKDVDRVVSHHAPDLLMYDVVGPLRSQGIDAYRTSWTEQFFPWAGSDGRFELRDIAITPGADVAFATGLIDCGGTEHGQRVEFTLRLTIGFEKRDGQWVIVHEHHSEPLPYE
ncbi:MAG TPA: SgcJ/EcaC family oxidoreductase [Caulifigura sp.]|nr:SgcJ/EcaC family oxidoreductase [Caulifigura sp.]